MKPRHSDVNTSRGNVQETQELGDEGFELSHLGVINGRRVIDQDPDVHLGITFTTSGLSDGSRTGGEGSEGEKTTIGKLGAANHGRIGNEIGQELRSLGWIVTLATRTDGACRASDPIRSNS